MSEPILIFSTAPSSEEAIAIARALVQEKLAACVHIGNTVKSVYAWKGKRYEAPEIPLMIKSERAVFGRVAARLKALHSYEVPEIIALPVVAGSEEYLKWIEENVRI